MCFNVSFWNEKYENNQTGWDLKSPSTPLKKYIDQLTDKNIHILIPGCGNAYEAEYLIENGFTNITLIDISDVLVNKLQKKFRNNSAIQIINQDFFMLNGKFDLILEQTFFCALHPDLRPDYVEKMHQLLVPQGKLVGLLFNHNFMSPGPPFGGSKEDHMELFQSKFEFKTLDICYNSIPPRAGNELFIQFIPKK
ncbi:MAG: methyltransferase domain-containing protein [Flavobacteriaceae bacterium]|nr:methyltransferase domain-containing protein [Candidatus Onthonaster equi]